MDRLSKPTVIDLFCGCGGLSEGFVQAGYEVQLAVDKNEAAARTYALNHKGTRLLTKDIRDVSVDDLRHTRETDVVVGGFPCKPFSAANRHNTGSNHQDHALYLQFLAILGELRPRAFMIENVPQISGSLSVDGDRTVLSAILAETVRLGYQVEYKVLNAAFFGVPQKRERIIIIGARSQTIAPPQGLLHPSTWLTVSDAIGDLPEFAFSQNHDSCQLAYDSPALSAYQEARVNGNI